MKTFTKLLIATTAIFATVTHAADLVSRWDFGTEEIARLTPHGGVHRDVPGPRAPEFLDFDAENTAVKFDGSGAHFVFSETAANGPYSFKNGDSITLEAWVDITESKDGENVYVIGKGRTGDPAFAKDNQNWALRLRKLDGLEHVSFLFATPRKDQAKGKDSHFHRWTSKAGFTPGSGWHRVAISYTYGEPDSIRGWLDADPADGTWDMGGETRDAPVVDDDAIWIASSMGGSASTSFRGSIDAISIYRGLVPDDVMRGRCRKATPTAVKAPAKVATVETAPFATILPPGKVVVTLSDGLKAHDAFPARDDEPKALMRWETDQLLVPRMPMKYDDWGIRQSWSGPALLRAEAEISLPPGKHRLLFRAREMGRLWVNGKVIARTKTHSGSADGYQPVPAVSEPPAPGVHPADYGDKEAFGDAEIGPDGRCHVVLEAILGAKKFRAETGELCVMVQTSDGKSYALVEGKFDESKRMNEDNWKAAASRAEKALSDLDDANRYAASSTQNAFWDKRHIAGRQWTEKHPAAVAPKLDGVAHPIDSFINARIQTAVAASAASNAEEAKHFYEKVLPILSENCFRCHGDKEKGGLRLNSRESALKSGASGKAAVVPGHPEKSDMLERITSKDEDERMPPTGERIKPEHVAILNAWIKAGASWPALRVTPEEVAQPRVVDDPAFVRRAYLDAIGVPPTEAEARAFSADTSADKRVKLIDRLLADVRYPDAWMGYWQDVLAENPNILKPSLNNSGPFRWFLYESMRDNKAFDRMVTELLMLRGSATEGGSAGFGMAADNDSPFAAKGQIVGSAFLGIELQCARCHDSPYHTTKQRDLYSIAAMFARKPLTVPKTSTVPAAFFEKKARESLIKVTLKHGEELKPEWPFAKTCGVAEGADISALMQKPDDSRERLAALITAPQNQRFASVIVNRAWKRLIGAGIVEPAYDWEGHAPSHPELLAWLAQEFVAHDYDFKHLVRTIMTSQMYQREATGRNLKLAPERRFFVAPERRRLNAEQIVDSLFAASGKTINVEELTFDPDTRSSATTLTSLGVPRRAWQFASLSNERDRPSLSLPRAQAVIDVLEAFGWFGSRQSPHTDRETDPNVLQPGVLENSTMSTWITRVSERSELAELAIKAESPEALVDSIFMRFLSRPPAKADRERFVQALALGFSNRIIPADQIKEPYVPVRLPKITWSTHLMAEATTVKLEMERRARLGDPADPRLNPAWRDVYEDVIWSVINSPEFVWMP
ncbi:MAG: DUF1553 domain-containing protein [Planctomycetota bacterium]